MPTVFTSIIKGDLPSHPIWRDDECAAFLSINPITDGHCLVVPIQEVDHWIDVPLSTTGRLLEVASLIGRSQMEAFQPNRIGQMIAGFEVAHTHLHVLPIWGMNDLDFVKAKTKVDHAELEKNAELIRLSLKRFGLKKVVESFINQ